MSAERGGKGGSGLSNTSRPLLILETVATQGPPAVTAKQIVAATGIPAPTVYRLVTTLLEEGFLERSDDHSGLVLGRRLSEIAEYFARQ